MLLIIAIVGTTVAPWQLFFQQSYVIDKRITPRFIRYERADLLVIVGIILFLRQIRGIHIASKATGSGDTGCWSVRFWVWSIRCSRHSPTPARSGSPSRYRLSGFGSSFLLYGRALSIERRRERQGVLSSRMASGCGDRITAVCMATSQRQVTAHKRSDTLANHAELIFETF